MSDETRQAVEPLRHEREAASYTPNVVPLIDVLFLLLLFFLLGTQLRQGEGDLPGRLPRGCGGYGCDLPNLDQEIEVAVTVRGTGEAGEAPAYELSGLPGTITNPQELYQKLSTRRQMLGTNDAWLVLKPKGNARWRFVVEAYNAALRARIKNVGFASCDG